LRATQLSQEFALSRLSDALAALASLMGAGGVALAALGAHADGGDLVKTASMFLVLHAAALVGVSAHARQRERANAILIGGSALAVGTILFSGDLAARAFSGARLFPFAAPIGGSLMILSWLGLAIIFNYAATGAPDQGADW
jgi:uncharacterized membrane protein YgdD (TMEM256/DUF423 family)